MWTYDDQAAWGEVPGWEVATSGKSQSPININNNNVIVNKKLTSLLLEGWDSMLSGSYGNTGHSLQFTPENSSVSLTTPHGKFSFKQFHFHWGTTSNQGSEHLLDGRSYSAEIHFVHEKIDEDSLAVLGVLCQANSELEDDTWKDIKVPSQPGGVISGNDVKLRNLLPSDLNYYFYKGSLTTPPCSEKVYWYVIKQPLIIPEEFLLKVRQMKDVTGQEMAFNFRQCMPLHGRSVETQ